MDTIKVCRKCLTEKTVNDFYPTKGKNGKTYYNKVCKACMIANNKPQTVEYQKAAQLKHKYQLTMEQFTSMVALYDGACHLCKKVPPKLVVDHDHSCCPGPRSCGECVRGVLCQHCNRLLGAAYDDPEILLQAIKYLNRD